MRNTSLFFPDHEQFISWLSAKTLQRGCPNCFVRVQKIFSRCGFFQLFCFWSKFDIWAIFFLTCGTNFSVKLSKLLSPCLDEHFDGKHFFGKFANLSLDFERNIFWTWVKITQKSSQKLILRVQKTFWWNWLFGELFDQYVYKNYEWKCFWISVVFSQTCPNRILRVQTNTLVSSFWKNSFRRFLVQTFSEVQQNLNRKIVKTSSYLFKKLVEETDCFEFSNVFGTYSNFGRKFFRLLAKKTSRKFVKNCFLHVQVVNLEEKKIFFKKIFWFDFRNSGETFSDYRLNFNR